MNIDDRIAAETAFACAALLEQGRKLQALSLLLTGIALFMLISVHPLRLERQLVALAALLPGIVALYFAIRVGLDRELMHRLATQADAGRIDLAAFDDGLTLARLRPAAAATRGLGERVTGALKLLRNQAIATAAQLVTLVAGAIWLGSAS